MWSTGRSGALVAVTVGLALALTACGGEAGTQDGPADSTPSPTEAVTQPGPGATATEAGGEATDEVTVMVTTSELGDILVDAEGNTLYAFLPDESGQPTCTGDCAATWPPYAGPAEAGEGVDADLLGTVDHLDGTTQVTYNDWPLYRYTGDAVAGDTNGQGLGENWYVVGPDGEPVRDAEPQEATGY